MQGDEAWKRKGNCADPREDPDAPFISGKRAQREATTMCRGCPVLEACLLASLEKRERFGVWGGLTEHQRARILALYPHGTDWRDIAAVVVANMAA